MRGERSKPEALPAQPSHWLGPRTIPAAALAVVLLAGLPLFVCMPVWPDVTFYDVCAWDLLRGGIPCRDFLLAGPPGMVLVQAGLRAVFGWGSAAVRCADLLFAGTAVWLLLSSPHARALSAPARLGTAAVLAFFYLGTTEWCHCQPDLWMLVPALGALAFLERQAAALLGEATPPAAAVVRRAVAEGVCWGFAVLIKPFPALSGAACLALLSVLVLRQQPARWRLLALELGGVFAGGLLVGGAAVAWLWASGNWPYFVANLRGGWNQEYFASSDSWSGRLYVLPQLMTPWNLLHLAGVPVALWTCYQAMRTPKAGAPRGSSQVSLVLLGAFYVGWLFQANLVQMQFLYHLAPTVLLVVSFLAARCWPARPRLLYWVALAGLLAAAALPVPRALPYRAEEWEVAPHPLCSPSRLALWGRCWRASPSPELRDALTLESVPEAPGWQELRTVARFLRGRGVREREVTCFHTSTVHLYRELNIQPSTRFLMLAAALARFPLHNGAILDELRVSPQRFVVSDLCDLGLTPEQARRRPVPRGPNAARTFPWSQPVVFRAGRYLVHRVGPPQERAPAAPAERSAR
jgi:hypothetical protein